MGRRAFNREFKFEAVKLVLERGMSAVCSAITRSRRRQQIFVMQAAQHRSGAHREALADPMADRWCRGRHEEAGRVGESPKDDSSRRDHATIKPRLGEGPANGSVRPGSNIFGAQASGRFHGLARIPGCRGRDEPSPD
jgi:transposase-like protein